MDLSKLFTTHLKELLARHRQLMLQNNIESMIVPSGKPVSIYLDDMSYPFKSSFLFRAYVPLMELAHSYVVIGLTGKPTLIYYQPVDYWHTPPSDPVGFWTEMFDIQIISQQQEARQYLPSNNEAVAILGEQTTITKSYTQAKNNPQKLLNAMFWQRAYKSDYEIACMKLANEAAALAHKVAEKAFRAGLSEQQIHLAYVEATGMLEHQMPYGNIVALNENGAVLHYTECQSQIPAQRKSFLIDAGVTVNGYHSDITRTYSFENDEFAELITAMNEMQLNCIEEIKTGQEYLDLHIGAHLKIAAIIQQFGLVDMSPEAMLESGVSATFFPHGLGHLIGLQVHDVGGQFADISGTLNPPPPSHPYLRATRKMEAKMVYTIEPGFYFIGSLLAEQRKGKNSGAFNWSKIETFMPYGGIRIEDDIVIEEGCVLNLTREAFDAL